MTTGRHLRCYWETFLMSSRSIAPYLIIVSCPPPPSNICIEYWRSLGQGSIPHSLPSMSFPLQFAPPYNGISHVRFRFCHPPPHETLQCSQSDQEPQTPSTVAITSNALVSVLQCRGISLRQRWLRGKRQQSFPTSKSRTKMWAIFRSKRVSIFLN